MDMAFIGLVCFDFDIFYCTGRDVTRLWFFLCNWCHSFCSSDLGFESAKDLNGDLICTRQRMGHVDHVSADMHEAYASAVLDEKAKCVGDKRNVSSGLVA